MTNNQDVVRDILINAYDEIVGRGLLTNLERDDLGDFITNFCDYTVEERELTEDQLETHNNKEYLGYQWKETK